MAATQGNSTADQDCGATWRQDFACGRGDRRDTGGVCCHVTNPRRRHVANQNRSRAQGDHAGSGRHATRQHTWQRLVRHTSRRHSTDKHSKFALDDRQRERRMGHRGRRRRRRVNRRMAMGCVLLNHIAKSGSITHHKPRLLTTNRKTFSSQVAYSRCPAFESMVPADGSPIQLDWWRCQNILAIHSVPGAAHSRGSWHVQRLKGAPRHALATGVRAMP